LAQLRLSFYPGLDFGFQGGLARLDQGPYGATTTTLRVGGDLRWQVARNTEAAPADIAVGGALGIETASHLTVVTLGPSAVASRALGGGAVTPYAGLALSFSTRDQAGHQTTDLSVPLRMGMEARFPQEIRLVAE